MDEIEETTKVLQKEYDKIKYMLPWNSSIYEEVAKQIMLYGNIIDMDKIQEIFDNKIIVRP